MELDWSEQSPHIRTLFRPWQPGDGYEEATIQAAEAKLGVRLPSPLRTFYLAWGKRRDLAALHHYLLAPDELVIRADTLIVWVDHQAVWYWGVRCEALEQTDPPVVRTESGPSGSGWEVESELDWKPSHAHVSSLFDDMTYLHAFCPGGAMHGGHYDRPGLPELAAPHRTWLEEHWNIAALASPPLFFGLMPDEDYSWYSWPPLYVRDGQAFCWEHAGCRLAVREVEVVDVMAQRFQIMWTKRW
jgi:hypothetical protein